MFIIRNNRIKFIKMDKMSITSAITTNDDELHFEHPHQRYQANARERYRTYSVNSAFTSLRELIPTEPKNRKLSKIETLRLAKSYIEHLGAVLITDDVRQPCLQNHQHEFTDNNSNNRSSICTFCVRTKK